MASFFRTDTGSSFQNATYAGVPGAPRKKRQVMRKDEWMFPVRKLNFDDVIVDLPEVAGARKVLKTFKIYDSN